VVVAVVQTLEAMQVFLPPEVRVVAVVEHIQLHLPEMGQQIAVEVVAVAVIRFLAPAYLQTLL
jgi:hypothetical protein